MQNHLNANINLNPNLQIFQSNSEVFYPNKKNQFQSPPSSPVKVFDQDQEPYKKKRSRKLNENSNWKNSEKVKACVFYAKIMTLNPYRYCEWSMRKPDGYFNKMALFIGKSKKQCKAFDQQLKLKNKVENLEDFLSFIKKTLRQNQDNTENCDQIIFELEKAVSKKEKEQNQLKYHLQQNSTKFYEYGKKIEFLVNSITQNSSNK